MQKLFDYLDSLDPRYVLLLTAVIGIAYGVWWLDKAVTRVSRSREELRRRRGDPSDGTGIVPENEERRKKRLERLARMNAIWDDPEWHTEGFDKTKDVA